MSENTAGQQSMSAYESRGNYRTNMTALGVRPGVLKAADGRLSFVADDGEVFFDAPVSELHSVGLAEMNGTLEIWQGPTRHRVSLVSGGPLVGNLVGEFTTDTVAGHWQAYLQPLVGPAPADVKVKKPLSKGAQVMLSVLLVAVLTIVVLVAVFMMG